MIVTGLTAQQLQASITQRLQNYVSSPEVSVIVQEVKSDKVNVVGRVVKPGSYSLSKPTTVLDAVVMAGGFEEESELRMTGRRRVVACVACANIHGAR